MALEIYMKTEMTYNLLLQKVRPFKHLQNMEIEIKG